MGVQVKKRWRKPRGLTLARASRKKPTKRALYLYAACPGVRVGELVREERTIQQGHDGLGARQRQRAQACALTTGEDDGLSGVGAAHGFQGCASSISITGMPSRIG